MAKVSKIIKVKKGKQFYFVMDEADFKDIQGEISIVAESQLREYGKIICDDKLLLVTEKARVERILQEDIPEEDFQRHFEVLILFIELEAQMLWNPRKKIFIKDQVSCLQELLEYTGVKKVF